MHQCKVEKLFPFLNGSNQQWKINVKTGHFEQGYAILEIYDFI